MKLPTNLASAPTIPALARKLGVNRRTMFNRMLKLHGQDRLAGRELWLFRHEGGTWRVDLSRLRRSHPEMFEAPSVEDLDSRLLAVEEDVAELKFESRAVAGAIRELRSAGRQAGGIAK